VLRINRFLLLAWTLLVLTLTVWLPTQAQTSTAATAVGSTSTSAPASTPAPASASTSASPAIAPAIASQSKFRITPVDDAWRAALPIEAKAATQAYMDRLPADVVARSNAYFEGGYWLQLWRWVAGVAVAALLLMTRPSTALRDWAARRLKWPPLRDAAYGAFYAAASWLLTLPLAIYEGFVREHAYGMATQNFAAWFSEQLTGLAVSLVVGALAVAALYAVLRRVGANWWLWGTGVTVALMALGIMVAPVYIEPLFNTYKPIESGPVKSAVLSMALANGVPVSNVYEFDASRQTTRVSANVAGLFGTAAVRLNDNLMRRSSEAEIRAVMGHEIGHYAMNHVTKTLAMFTLLFMACFLVTQWVMARVLAKKASAWRLGGPADVASLPLLVVIFSTCLLLATPVINTIIRTQETEADLWGLNVAREPHGEAEVLLKLTEYRKPDPGPWEEIFFFDHPSTRTRIMNAMRWREQMLPR
jgi:STE24 endopeptidase